VTTIDGMLQEPPPGGPGAPGAPVDARPALILIDVAAGSTPPPSMLAAVVDALSTARRTGSLVVHVLRRRPGHDAAPHPSTAPRPDEPVLEAPGASAFSAPELALLLRSRGVTDVVVVGEPLRDMVLSTLISGRDRGFHMTLLADASADPDPALQRVLTERLIPRYGNVVTSTVFRLSGGRTARRRFRTRVWVAVGVAVAVIVVLGVLVVRGSRGYYEFSPGTAPLVTADAACRARPAAGDDLALPGGTPCVRLIVPAGQAHPVSGSLFMVDVFVGPATVDQYVENKLGLLNVFHDGMQLVPKDEVLGSTPASQLNCQDAQQMTGSTEAASVVALRRLGYQVKEDDLGVVFGATVPGSPAARAGLQTTDMITAIDGRPTPTTDALVAALHARPPGSPVTIEVQRPSGADCKLGPVELHTTLVGTPAEGGQAAQPNVSFLGIAGLTTNATYTLPIGVSVQVGSIGGPSAGLALTLGLLDVLSNGHLTGGHKVAATGTMDPSGNVGDVGGVAQKTVAVRRAGAELFLVPPQEYQTAKSEAGPHMKVEAVSTLQQALDDLKAIGGQIPPPTPTGGSPSGT